MLLKTFRYDSPECEILDCTVESVLCASVPVAYEESDIDDVVVNKFTW